MKEIVKKTMYFICVVAFIIPLSVMSYCAFMADMLGQYDIGLKIGGHNGFALLCGLGWTILGILVVREIAKNLEKI